MEHYLTTTEARQRFLKLIDDALAGDQIIVTKHGKPAVAIIDVESLTTLRDMARLWQDPEALAAMQASARDSSEGRVLRGRQPIRVRSLLSAARAKGLLRG